jgi:hypothetical protein
MGKRRHTVDTNLIERLTDGIFSKAVQPRPAALAISTVKGGGSK